jgi:hypothetical protein
VAGCCDYGEGHSGSGSTELVIIHGSAVIILPTIQA